MVKLRKIKLEKERINKIIEELSRENKATLEDFDKYLNEVDAEKKELNKK